MLIYSTKDWTNFGRINQARSEQKGKKFVDKDKKIRTTFSFCFKNWRQEDWFNSLSQMFST